MRRSGGFWVSDFGLRFSNFWAQRYLSGRGVEEERHGYGLEMWSSTLCVCEREIETATETEYRDRDCTDQGVGEILILVPRRARTQGWWMVESLNSSVGRRGVTLWCARLRFRVSCMVYDTGV